MASRHSGEVAERSIAADCKSAALVATEVRTLPSPPTFARGASYGWQATGRAMSRTAAKVGASGLARRSAEQGLRARREGGSNSVVESQPSKLLVAGSIPVSRSRLRD
jgi:hypothetical protein